MADETELVAHARELRDNHVGELPNGVGNTMDALCDAIEALQRERGALAEQLHVYHANCTCELD